MIADQVAFVARQSTIRSHAIQEAEVFLRSHLWALEDAAVNDLYRLYIESYTRLAGQLAATAAQYGAGETWSASDQFFRQRTEALMAQVTAEAESLSASAAGLSLDISLRSYLAAYYGRAWQLDMGLRPALSSYDRLPTDAIRAQMLAPYQGLTFLDRFMDARDEFVRRIRRALVESQIEGESIYLAQKRLADALGVQIGRRTAAARAANAAYFNRLELIARTEILRASNLGALAIYERNADVLRGWSWQASRDARVCPVCGALDGQQFEFGKGHSPPPAHARCLPGNSMVTAIGISAASERWYDGNLIVIHTACGNDLACTPNHPIFTRQGWVAAGLLNEGGYVISGNRRERESFRGNLNNQNVPARIEEIVETFRRAPEMVSTPMPITAEDFHGDGIGSQVAIIRSNRLLWDRVYSARHQHICQTCFQRGGARLSALSSEGLSDLDFERQNFTSPRIMGGLSLALTPLGGHLRPFEFLRFTSSTRRNARLEQSAANSWSTHPIFLGSPIFGQSIEIIPDQIIKIERRFFSGHVYNLQTEREWYIAGGIITHNCRCTPMPLLIDSALEARVVGPYQTYREWASERGITIAVDGGGLYFRGAPAPRSPGAAAAKAAPHLYKGA